MKKMLLAMVAAAMLFSCSKPHPEKDILQIQVQSQPVKKLLFKE